MLTIHSEKCRNMLEYKLIFKLVDVNTFIECNKYTKNKGVTQMLLFSTILSIKENLTKDKFIDLVIQWNQGSPHADNIITGIEWNGERNIKFEDGKLSLTIEEYRNGNIIAIRYEKKDEDGVVWDTDYVMNFSTNKMGIRLDRSYLESAVAPNTNFSTPHFISLLIDGKYLEKDYELEISNKPHLIEDDEIDRVADIVNGKRFHLPVVYVSKTYHNEDPLDVNLLAKRLKGVAHVFVQQSNCSNMRLRKLCSDKNDYYGAIGIYYPIQTENHRRFLYRSYPGNEKHYLDRIVNTVISHSNARMVESLYTWQGVNHALLRDRLESQREERAAAEKARREALYEVIALKGQHESVKREALEKAKEEANDILDSFDEEIRRMQEQIDELTHANEKLQYENQGLKAKIDSNQEQPLLFFGTENEFYLGEIKDLILSSLNDQLSNIESKTRRYDVVQDIIQSNDYQEINKKRVEEARRLLKNYNGMTSKVRKGLEDMGFKVTHEGDHYKAIYYSDERYTVVYGATPSDNRAGKNNVSNTVKKVF